MTDGHLERRPILTVDCVLLTLSGDGLSVALLPRERDPFAGRPALPGGFVHVEDDADLTATARRVLAQKVGLGPEDGFLEQLGAFSGPARDPRGWSASVAYYALLPADELARCRPEAVVLAPVDRLPPLPFDHADIVRRAVERLRGKTSYSTLPGFLLPREFTLPELQDVYERVMDRRLDQSVFRRRMDELDLIEPVSGSFRTGGRHRPAQLYRLRRPTVTVVDRIIPQRARG